MKLFTAFLEEELSDKQKTMVDKMDAPHPAFSDHVFGEKGSHIDIPLSENKSNHQEEVESHLARHGYTVHDYSSGKAKDQHGRDVNIGRVLARTNAPKALIDRHANAKPSKNDHPDHFVRIYRGVGKEGKYQRFLVWIGIVQGAGMLLYFKYFNPVIIIKII